mmetsp:Transcript_29578/g.50220  ORF Transcript_29578/g.50220 Transcript_29578/m.50220 type:complete len:225 (-) Transcript_29578:3078-3752(-)
MPLLCCVDQSIGSGGMAWSHAESCNMLLPLIHCSMMSETCDFSTTIHTSGRLPPVLQQLLVGLQHVLESGEQNTRGHSKHSDAQKDDHDADALAHGREVGHGPLAPEEEDSEEHGLGDGVEGPVQALVVALRNVQKRGAHDPDQEGDQSAGDQHMLCPQDNVVDQSHRFEIMLHLQQPHNSQRGHDHKGRAARVQEQRNVERGNGQEVDAGQKRGQVVGPAGVI